MLFKNWCSLFGVYVLSALAIGLPTEGPYGKRDVNSGKKADITWIYLIYLIALLMIIGIFVFLIYPFRKRLVQYLKRFFGKCKNSENDSEDPVDCEHIEDYVEDQVETVDANCDQVNGDVEEQLDKVDADNEHVEDEVEDQVETVDTDGEHFASDVEEDTDTAGEDGEHFAGDDADDIDTVDEDEDESMTFLKEKPPEDAQTNAAIAVVGKPDAPERALHFYKKKNADDVIHADDDVIHAIYDDEDAIDANDESI